MLPKAYVYPSPYFLWCKYYLLPRTYWNSKCTVLIGLWSPPGCWIIAIRLWNLPKFLCGIIKFLASYKCLELVWQQEHFVFAFLFFFFRQEESYILTLLWEVEILSMKSEFIFPFLAQKIYHTIQWNNRLYMKNQNNFFSNDFFCRCKNVGISRGISGKKVTRWI